MVMARERPPSPLLIRAIGSPVFLCARFISGSAARDHLLQAAVEGTGGQDGPGDDEGIVGDGLLGAASLIGLAVQQIDELAGPLSEAAEPVQ